MGLILARSPFNISRENFDPNVNMVVEIGLFKDGIFDISQTYNITYKNSLFVGISNLIRSELSDSYAYDGASGAYQGGEVKNVVVKTTIQARTGGSTVPDIVNYYLAVDGYLYNSEAMNYDHTSYLESNCCYAGSSDVIYKLDDSNIRIPLLNPSLDVSVSQVTEDAVISTFLKGELVQQISHTFDSELSSSFTPIIKDLSYSSFMDRVDEDGGVYEESKCLLKFFRETNLNNIDKIVISYNGKAKVIKVETISECKYPPYRVTFKNRFGASEDLWFFKKSKESISVSSDEFKANQIAARSSGNLARTTQEYNKNGTRSFVLNSGFVNEAVNESFKELMLSERVELYDYNSNRTTAVKIKDSELKLKTSVNDKLINYTIEVEESNNLIDNIV